MYENIKKTKIIHACNFNISCGKKDSKNQKKK